MIHLKSWDNYEMFMLTRDDEQFYCILGPFFGSRKIAKELGMPIYDDDNRVWFIVFNGGKAIACSSLELKKNKVILKSSWVHSEHRNKGVFDQIFKERLKYIKASGYKKIEGTTTGKSRNTYLRYGFINTRMKGRYYVMEKELTDND